MRIHSRYCRTRSTTLLRWIVILILAMTFVLPSYGGQKRRRLRSIKADVTEKKITKKALPAEVLKSFEEKYPTATIKGQLKETSEGSVYYEIESIDSSRARNVLFKPDGTIVEIEESTPPERVPQFVQDSVKVKYPDAKIISAESVTRDNHAEYELVIGVGKKTFEVIVSPSGKIFKIK
jgi:hypothetical protein